MSHPNPRSSRRVGDYLPWPLVGVALLLVLLIVLTPVLNSSGGQPAAGTVFTQAELIVDRVPNGNTTHFYVRGLGSTVRYASIEVTWATGFNWTGSGTPVWSRLAWTIAINATDLLSTTLSTTENPIALNVTALYDANGIALYVGVFAFYISSGSASPPNSLIGISPTATVIVPPSTAISGLPLPIPLADVGSGGH